MHMRSSSTTTLMNHNTAQDRGIKRSADDSLDDEQRFTKRFNLLNLLDRDGSKLYIPVAPKTHSRPPPSSSRTNNSNQDEHMQLDDTKDRVYIHDLEEELADIESDEEKLIFLPDIEKKLSRIPQHVLTGSRPEVQEHQELVLYSVPSSLSVPAEKDTVRKAIVEARQRAREKSAREMEEATQRRNMHDHNEPETAHGFSAEEYDIQEADDPDAMDMG